MMKSNIVNTAATLFDFSGNSGIKGIRKIKNYLLKNNKDLRSFSPKGLSYLVMFRFLTSHSIIEKYADKNTQIIELGSGFTPHAINLKKKVDKYIEVDFPKNIAFKKKINKVFKIKNEMEYVGGDLLKDSTWKRLYKKVDPSKKIIVFSEGVISVYFNDKQKDFIASHLKKLLLTKGSFLALDDTFRSHPELENHPVIKESIKKIASYSKAKGYKKKKFVTLKMESSKWLKRFGKGFGVKFVPYVIVKKFEKNNLGRKMKAQIYMKINN